MKRHYYNVRHGRYVRCRTMLKFLIPLASLRRDVPLAGYSSQVFNVLTESSPKLLKNYI